MKVLELECPGCRVKLRLRDRLQGGRTFGCPDCFKELMLVEVAGTYEVTIPPPVKTLAMPETVTNSPVKVADKPKSQTTSPTKSPVKPQNNRLLEWFSDPWTVAWMLALGFTFLFIRVVLWPSPVANPIPKINHQQVETTPANPNPTSIEPVPQTQAQPAPPVTPQQNPQEHAKVETPVTPEKMHETAPENVAVVLQPETSKEPQTKVLGVEEVQADGTMKQATSVINLEQTLSLTLKTYQQKKPLLANVLLVELEPLTGVEIQTHNNDLAALKILAEQQVQLPDLDNVTVKNLLEMVAKELGLEMVLGNQVIYFQSPGFKQEAPVQTNQ